MTGIDLCCQQHDVNWKLVKQSGQVDFIIPRTGWGVDCDGDGIDYKFLEYVKGAQDNGISVPGVYHFIYVDSLDDAVKNAQCAIRAVEAAGLPKSTIIWCDQEEDTVIRAVKHGFNLTTDLQRKVTDLFCEYVLSQGYCTGVYLNQDYIKRVYGESILAQYDIWLADLEGDPYCDCLYRQYDWHGKINGIGSDVDLDVYCGTYTAGTAKPKNAKEDAKKEEGVNMGKPKSKIYVQVALDTLDRQQGLNYKNWYPNNCGYCEDDKSMSGDCWNMHPKATTWSLFLSDPVSKNFTPGKFYYTEGIQASGLPDVVGNTIMEKYCEQTTFKQMVSSPKAPCFCLINGSHMGAYLGEFVRDGKTYNVSEFSPNDNLEGKMRSYIDEYGRRLTHKGGKVIGTWNRCGYLTAFLDYSDWDEPEPAPIPEPEPDPSGITDLTLALQIYKGDWGNNPGRKASLILKYGEAKYNAAQKIVDSIVSSMNWLRIEIQLADEILHPTPQKDWGNNPQRQEQITLKYGANAYRIAQMFVNDICHDEYTIDDLWNGLTVADEILRNVYGNDPERTEKIVAKYGKTVRTIAQNIVNSVLPK